MRLIWSSLAGNRLRSILLILSVAVAFLLYGALSGLLAVLDPSSSVEAGDELMVHNRINMLQGLPVSYGAAIARTDGIVAATHVNVLGGYFRDESDPVTTMMVDAPSYLAFYAKDIQLSRAGAARFLAERDGIILDRQTAQAHGWKVGDRFSLTSDLYLRKDGSHSWPFVLSAIFDGPKDSGLTGGIGHYDYLNLAMVGEPNRVHWFTVRTTGAAGNIRVATAIDRRFANSSAETTTQPAAAMAQAFLGQLGDLAFIVRIIVGASFLTILMIVGNTLALSVRQRTREFGILRAIGFPPVRISLIVLGEALVIAAVGGIVGIGLAGVTVGQIEAQFTGQAAQTWSLPIGVLTGAAGIVLLLALLTGGLPSYRAMRMTPTEAIRRG